MITGIFQICHFQRLDEQDIENAEIGTKHMKSWLISICRQIQLLSTMVIGQGEDSLATALHFLLEAEMSASLSTIRDEFCQLLKTAVHPSPILPCNSFGNNVMIEFKSRLSPH